MIYGPLRIANVTGPFSVVPADAIAPVEIVHEVDDLREGHEGALYNFLSYRFERDGAQMMARAYLHAIDDVLILTMAPPSTGVETALMQDVVAYLKRRYGTVTLLHEKADRG